MVPLSCSLNPFVLTGGSTGRWGREEQKYTQSSHRGESSVWGWKLHCYPEGGIGWAGTEATWWGKRWNLRDSGTQLAGVKEKEVLHEAHSCLELGITWNWVRSLDRLALRHGVSQQTRPWGIGNTRTTGKMELGITTPSLLTAALMWLLWSAGIENLNARRKDIGNDWAELRNKNSWQKYLIGLNLPKFVQLSCFPKQLGGRNRN